MEIWSDLHVISSGRAVVLRGLGRRNSKLLIRAEVARYRKFGGKLSLPIMLTFSKPFKSDNNRGIGRDIFCAHI